MPVIDQLSALEILDSRGKPTVQATCVLADGSRGTAQIPSGRSTGAHEAHELRDGDPQRYGGSGCLRAVRHIETTLAEALAGRSFNTQADLDSALLDLDGTPDKSHLGANALLGVSFAFARAAAAAAAVPLYRYFATLVGMMPETMPRPMINLFSGGKHGGGQIPLQDLLIIPVAARTTDEVLRVTYDVFYTAADLIAQQYDMRLLTADEGGLAPAFPNLDSLFELALAAIRQAGYKPGEQVALALDVAASHFHANGMYHLGVESVNSAAMIDVLADWVDRYPVVSIEDGLVEDDWLHWRALNKRLGERVQIVGDDFLCTNPDRIRRAAGDSAANTLLLKPNQVGTLTEAAEAYRLARAAGWRVIISARSGETEDNWLADLAVGWGGDQIKIGSINQSERLAKYNRLLAIEAETGLPLIAR